MASRVWAATTRAARPRSCAVLTATLPATVGNMKPSAEGKESSAATVDHPPAAPSEVLIHCHHHILLARLAVRVSARQ